MIDDDDLFVVIVDDGTNDADAEHGKHVKSKFINKTRVSYVNFENDWEVENKHMTQDSNVDIENILYTAKEHGEILHLEDDENNYSIGEASEAEFDTEYDTLKFKFDTDDDDDYRPQFVCDDDQSSVNSTDEHISKKRTHWKNKNKVIVSYVQTLKKKFPHLRNNKEYLIRSVAQKMKNTFPPDPPPNYFTCDGDIYRCNFCVSKNPTEPLAQSHYQEKHGERYLTCFACGSTFRRATNLYKHEKLNCLSPDINIVLRARASILGRKGRSRPFLPNLHNLTRKRYECTECTATFAHKNSLEPHLRMHRGERPFLCPQCPRAYTSHMTMTHHMRKHSDKVYICDHCGKNFKEKGKLGIHLASHAPMKKYGCGECRKRYSTKADLTIHVNRDHRKLPLPFDCKICPKRFARMATLKCHMKKAHGMIIMTSRMFARQLPEMSEKQLETQVQHAIVVFKNSDASYNNIKEDFYES